MNDQSKNYQSKGYQPKSYQLEDFKSEDFKSEDCQMDTKSLREDKPSPSIGSVIVSGILGGVIAFVLLAYVFPQYPFKGPRFGIVDTATIIHERAQTLGKQKLSKKALQEDQGAFIEKLNAVLNQLSKEKNGILLNPDAVAYSHLPDYTDEVVERIRLLEIIEYANEHKEISENVSED